MSAARESAAKPQAATLVRSRRIAPPDSPAEVRRLVFQRGGLSIRCQAGHCLRVMASGARGAAQGRPLARGRVLNGP